MIRLADVSFRYPDGTLAVRDVELEVQDGECLVLCGANGCGKSTLLRLMNGLVEPTEGSVTVGGTSTRGSPVDVRADAGLVFQDPDAQIIGETVRDDIAFGPENLGCDDETVARRVARSLAVTGLEALADKPTHLLSGGEKRRLAIAGVLAMNPRIILLDEPLANLDFPGTRDVLQRLADLRAAGTTLVIATHDIEKILEIADRLVLMREGRIERCGPPEDLLDELAAFEVRPPGASYFNGSGTCPSA